MAVFKLHDHGIFALTPATVALFSQLEGGDVTDPNLSAADLQAFANEGKLYTRIDNPAQPFRPNPVAEPSTGMMLFAHPDHQKDVDRMVGLYYDVLDLNPDGSPIINPRKWLIGPKTTAVIPYQWTCCGGFSAIFAAGDAEYTPGQAHKATATIQDPPTVQPEHAQWFNCGNGTVITHDTKGELKHILIHLLEQAGHIPQGSHNCTDHAPITAGPNTPAPNG